jgi:hypothetical protein
MPHLLSYGTLQKEQVQIETFGRILQGDQDILTGYRLEMLEITDPEVLRKSSQKFHPILKFQEILKMKLQVFYLRLRKRNFSRPMNTK